MVTKIQKWGNSLGLRIPKSIAMEAGIGEGSTVEISIQEDKLVIQPIHPPRYELKDLVSQIRDENLHDEITTGDPVGREIW